MSELEVKLMKAQISEAKARAEFFKHQTKGWKAIETFVEAVMPTVLQKIGEASK